MVSWLVLEEVIFVHVASCVASCEGARGEKEWEILMYRYSISSVNSHVLLEIHDKLTAITVTTVRHVYIKVEENAQLSHFSLHVELVNLHDDRRRRG